VFYQNRISSKKGFPIFVNTNIRIFKIKILRKEKYSIAFPNKPLV
jgi:hypothetical protein